MAHQRSGQTFTKFKHQDPIGSMRLVCLPTWNPWKSTIHVGKLLPFIPWILLDYYRQLLYISYPERSPEKKYFGPFTLPSYRYMSPEKRHLKKTAKWKFPVPPSESQSLLLVHVYSETHHSNHWFIGGSAFGIPFAKGLLLILFGNMPRIASHQTYDYLVVSTHLQNTNQIGSCPNHVPK